MLLITLPGRKGKAVAVAQKSAAKSNNGGASSVKGSIKSGASGTSTGTSMDMVIIY